MLFRTMLALLIIGGATLAADDDKADRVLFQFNAADAAKQWQSVNDGVMGGRSDGSFKITDDKSMQFFGTLSLENNGGFASVRTRPTKLNLKKGDRLKRAKVKSLSFHEAYWIKPRLEKERFFHRYSMGQVLLD